MNFRRKSHGLIVFDLIVAILLLPFFTGPAFGQTRAPAADGPERLVTLGVEYPGVIIAQGEDISMDILVKNKGRRDENVQVGVGTNPEGWKTAIKTYNFQITGVYVPAKDEKRLSLKIVPAENVKPGSYVVEIVGNTDDNVFRLKQAIHIDIKKKEDVPVVEKGIRLTTSYPEIKGPSDGSFEFSVEVKSELDSDAVFNLLAQGPEGWEINIKPAYESKYISSLRIKANQSQTIAVEVKPDHMAAAGEYPVTFHVSSGNISSETKLSVILTGTYNLDMSTASGLLSLDAHQGKVSQTSLYIRNTGSAANHNVKLISFKPENWKVDFKPAEIPVIEPGDMVQVEMSITPNDQALVGDYSVDAKVQGEKASPSVKFRVSVKASAVWGWVGIGIIIIVIAGLFIIFKVFGRR
jgi:uncharacterized membrane protein